MTAGELIDKLKTVTRDTEVKIMFDGGLYVESPAVVGWIDDPLYGDPGTIAIAEEGCEEMLSGTVEAGNAH